MQFDAELYPSAFDGNIAVYEEERWNDMESHTPSSKAIVENDTDKA